MIDKLFNALNDAVRPLVFANATIKDILSECEERVKRIADITNLQIWAGGYYKKPDRNMYVVSYTLTKENGMPVADITFYVEFKREKGMLIAGITGVDLLLMFRPDTFHPSA